MVVKALNEILEELYPGQGDAKTAEWLTDYLNECGFGEPAAVRRYIAGTIARLRQEPAAPAQTTAPAKARAVSADDPAGADTAVKIIARYEKLQRESGFSAAEFELFARKYFGERKVGSVAENASRCVGGLETLERMGIIRKIRSPDGAAAGLYLAAIVTTTASSSK